MCLSLREIVLSTVISSSSMLSDRRDVDVEFAKVFWDLLMFRNLFSISNFHSMISGEG